MTLDGNEARIAASASPLLRDGIALGQDQELREGWFFPFVTGAVGSNGVIVNKQTGKLFHLGSAFPAERDLDLYDRGYQFDSYDLVIVAVHDRKRALHSLDRIGLDVVEPKTEYGVVWRVPRRLTRAELKEKLDALPCMLPALKLYFVIEHLEKARLAGWFTFELREHVPAGPPGASVR